ncbi:MAG: recombination regulator RecX [Candidatus Cyclonatronum sp.]|uniref:regulatory protein RecX n=1 Tax=Cyclonatronum sp. TaxID=3024185 RepID=UPI0025B89489|nr:regulatory protein RecX [Cyclonatronum sp.]MCC5934207.1 regulatory protein RecX [Balneolales bacterium]MCH8487034.1 recombination regulator RecX [Cyclonatronum sp.]
MRRKVRQQPKDDAPEPEFSPGRITGLNTQTRNSSRVSVFIEGEFSFGCYKAVFLESGLGIGKELDLDGYDLLMKQESRFSLREYWLSLLARRAHTSVELIRKARKKEFTEMHFDSLLDEFRDKGYLDERAYARAYIREVSSLKKWGAAKVRAELKKRGVPEPVLAELIPEMLPDNDIAALEALVLKNSRRFRRESDILKRKKKVADHLLRKGHAAEQVFRNLNRLLELIDSQPDG